MNVKRESKLSANKRQAASGLQVENDSDGTAAVSGCNISDRDGSAANINHDIDEMGK